MSSLLKLSLIAVVVGWYQLPVMHERSQTLALAGAEVALHSTLESLRSSVGAIPLSWRSSIESAKISAQASALAMLTPAVLAENAPSRAGRGASPNGSGAVPVVAPSAPITPVAPGAVAGHVAAGRPPENSAPPAIEATAPPPVASSSPTASPKVTDAGPPLAKASTQAGRGGTVLLVGDSVMGEIAYGMKRWSAKNKAWTVVDAHKVSSGLSNLDYYDWPAVFEELMAQHKPAAVAMMVGSNDAQDIFANRKRHAFGSPGWVELYGERTRAILRCAEQHGVKVYWAIPPVMKSAAFEKRMSVVRTTLKAALAAHPRSGVLLDEWARFAGDKDEYLETGLVGGKTRALRTDDGIHLSVAGAQVFVDALIEALTPAPSVETPAGSDAEMAPVQARPAETASVEGRGTP